MKILLIILLTLFSITTHGQTDSTNHIDQELQDCLNSSENYTTKGMTDCVIKATEKWDTKLNKTYKDLLELLTLEQKERLKVAQREWIEYRNREIEFSHQVYSNRGTMWIPVAAEKKLELTRQRTFELESYISNLTIE